MSVCLYAYQLVTSKLTPQQEPSKGTTGCMLFIFILYVIKNNAKQECYLASVIKVSFLVWFYFACYPGLQKKIKVKMNQFQNWY